jgi:folate-binding protein YgfZ
MTAPIPFPDRGIISVSGADAAQLLNGLLTRDVDGASADTLLYAAMLTPQGKFLYELFVSAPEPQVFWLDVNAPKSFAKRLALYRLRAQVKIEDLSDQIGVGSLSDPSEPTPDTLYALADPRNAALPKRVGIKGATDPLNDVDFLTYEAKRHALGVPDLARDLLAEKDFLLEGLMDELGGVDFHKGCYVGQEMTSRMKRRTTVKTKLCRVTYPGAPPEYETPIIADGWEVGRMRTGSVGVGMALIRFDRAHKAISEGHALMAGETAIELAPPEWLHMPS